MYLSLELEPGSCLKPLSPQIEQENRTPFLSAQACPSWPRLLYDLASIDWFSCYGGF